MPASRVNHPIPEFDPPLDEKIAPYVRILNERGIETFESCQGGAGHSYAEPAIRFHGQFGEGFLALAIALDHNFPVTALRRYWSIEDGEPVGPAWELVLYLP